MHEASGVERFVEASFVGRQRERMSCVGVDTWFRVVCRDVVRLAAMRCNGDGCGFTVYAKPGVRASTSTGHSLGYRHEYTRRRGRHPDGWPSPGVRELTMVVVVVF